MSSPEASPASLFLMPESEEEETMTVISGRRCSGLLAKSGPLGSLVRTLLESPLWWKEGYYLTWEAIPLSSRKVTTFTDTNLTNPLPSNESAETLSVSDIPSSRCLFRLRLSALPTGETESSSSPLMLTPTSVMYSDTPEEMQARKKRNGYRNGTKYVNLETQLKYDPKYASMLPTPQAMDGTDVRSIMGKNDVLVETASGLRRVVQTGSDFGVSLGFMANNELLPTPRTCSAMGTSLETDWIQNKAKFPNLEQVVARKILPTPIAGDWKGQKRGDGKGEETMLCGIVEKEAKRLLPTPTVIHGGPNKIKDGKRVYHEDKKGGGFSAQLQDLAVAGLLPTPTARDEKNPSSPDGARIARKREQGYTIELNDLAAMGALPTPDSSPKTDGGTFRLSPLFTQEMMGFPSTYLVLPFLLPSGEPNP